MLIAEELDVEWSQVRVIQLPYGYEEIDGKPSNRYGDQFAGGSTSIPTAWKDLREAGALARWLLLQAAANAWAVPVESLRHRVRTRASTPTVARLSYGALARTAAALADARQVASPEESRNIQTGRQADTRSRRRRHRHRPDPLWHRRVSQRRPDRGHAALPVPRRNPRKSRRQRGAQGSRRARRGRDRWTEARRIRSTDRSRRRHRRTRRQHLGRTAGSQRAQAGLEAGPLGGGIDSRAGRPRQCPARRRTRRHRGAQRR